jgi:PPOX class probable F420-dependent enzyme
MKPLPDSVKKLIEGKTFANVASLMADGSPHVVPTFVDHDGDIVLINTFEGSQLHANAVRDARIALDVFDPANYYDRAVIRGRVKEVTFDGVEEHLDRLAQKYLGVDKYLWRPGGIRRVFIKIEPTHVIAPGEGNRWQDAQKKM